MDYLKLKALLMEEVTSEELRDMVNDCNSWNGSLEDYRYAYNDEDFFQTFFSGRLYNLVGAICNGEYNQHDEWVRFDVYNYLVSKSTYEVNDELDSNKEEIIDTFLELLERNQVDKSIIQEYIDKVEEEEEEE